jgi:hypothetical protein
VTIKYTNILHSKVLQYVPKFGFFGSKIYHLATLLQAQLSKLAIACMVEAGEKGERVRLSDFHDFVEAAAPVEGFDPLTSDDVSEAAEFIVEQVFKFGRIVKNYNAANSLARF